MFICCSESWKKPAYFFGKMNRVPALPIWFSLLSSIFWPETPPLQIDDFPSGKKPSRNRDFPHIFSPFPMGFSHMFAGLSQRIAMFSCERSSKRRANLSRRRWRSPLVVASSTSSTSIPSIKTWPTCSSELMVSPCPRESIWQYLAISGNIWSSNGYKWPKKKSYVK